MRTRARRIVMAAVVVLTGAIVLAGPGTGCVSFLGESTLTTTDFCFIFDCQDGILGGTIDPCPGIDTNGASGQLPLFVDCPGFVAP